MRVADVTLTPDGALDPARLRIAAERYQAFFAELREAFVEGDDVLTQFGLALLSREQALMTGPSGTAKSRLAHASEDRIVDEQSRQPSLFARHLPDEELKAIVEGQRAQLRFTYRKACPRMP